MGIKVPYKDIVLKEYIRQRNGEDKRFEDDVQRQVKYVLLH